MCLCTYLSFSERRNRKLNPLIAYDTVHRYDNILKNILSQNRYFAKYICNKQEPSINEQALPLLDTLLQQLQKTITEIHMLERCFLYEYNYYQQQTELSNIDKLDAQACKSKRWQLHRIKTSFIETQNYVICIQRTFQNFHISTKSPVLQAVRYLYKKQSTRCQNIHDHVLCEYILVSMYRPYYLYHLKQQKSLIDTDIQTSMRYGYSVKHQHAYNSMQPYIEKVAIFASMSGKENYKHVRIQEYQDHLDKLAQQKAEKQAQTIMEKQKQYQQRLAKFCISREQTYQNQPWHSKPILAKLVQHPDYTVDANNCCIIACLCKPKTGNCYFAYYNSHQLTRRMSDIQSFFFEKKNLEACIQECYSFPDVQAVDTISLY